MFDRIAIIGMGLIGSSIARNVREKGLAKTLVAGDLSEDVCHAVVELDLADYVTRDLARAVEGADLVILAVPVGAMAAAMRGIAPGLKDNVIISDTGSVKMAVIEAVRPYLRAGMEFIPAHPIAGTEFSGPESGFAKLFQGRWCILTPMPETEIRAVEKLTQFWEACGSMIEIMEPAHHDLVLGITSHLPHLIAYTIVGTATELEEDTKSEVIKFSASGFRDFTRIAASDPVMWRDVFLNNKVAVLEILQRFTEDLTALQKAIRQGDGDYLYQTFDKTRAIRKAIVDQGQA
ncbi:MAG: prephenate/arogenate dehydrogenase family protein [Alphaproteobacteria bacterium]|nr:prephenate/arogenate dehydrogenase family protein [Alphaproteobacteria bacterium]